MALSFSDVFKDLQEHFDTKDKGTGTGYVGGMVVPHSNENSQDSSAHFDKYYAVPPQIDRTKLYDEIYERKGPSDHKIEFRDEEGGDCKTEFSSEQEENDYGTEFGGEQGRDCDSELRGEQGESNYETELRGEKRANDCEREFRNEQGVHHCKTENSSNGRRGRLF